MNPEDYPLQTPQNRFKSTIPISKDEYWAMQNYLFSRREKKKQRSQKNHKNLGM